MTIFGPKKNVAFTVVLPLVVYGAGDWKTAPTLAAGDFKISKDGGALANVATLPTVAPAGSAWLSIVLSSDEMNADRIQIQCIDQTATKEWEDTGAVVYTTTYGAGAEVGAIATGAITAASIAADAIGAAEIAAAACNKIADHVRRRTQVNVEASSDGDTLGFESEYGAIAKLTHKVAVDGSNLKTYKSDGATVLGTQAITSSEGADPISGLGDSA